MSRRRTKAGTSRRSRADRIKLFVAAMLKNGGNATQSAVAAGYTPGKAAEQAGWRLSKDVEVRQLLDEAHDRVVDDAIADRIEVLRSATRQIRFDPRKLVDAEGKPKKLHELDDETALAISSLEIGGVKIRIERGASREQLMKHLGLFKEDNLQQPLATVVHPPGVLTVKFDPIPKTRKG